MSKGFEVFVKTDGKYSVVFVPKGGVNNEAMEQLFIQGNICDSWMFA